MNYLKEIIFLVGEDKKKLPWLVICFVSSSILDLVGLALIGPYITLLVNTDDIIGNKVSFLLEKLGFN